MIKPNFFILGAPKCGTTALASWLAEHPHVFMSPIKEPHYFNDDDPEGIESLEAYQTLFAQARPAHRAIGEASVRYLHSHTAVRRILSYNPDSRFIVMLRNPIEMAPAMHEQAVFSFIEDVPDFGPAWHLQSARLAGAPLPVGCGHPSHVQYGSYCRLGEQVRRLLDQVPRDACHFILLEDMKADPRSEWLRVLAHLRVDDDGRTAFAAENAAKERRFPVITQPLYRAGKRIRSAFPNLRVLHSAMGAVDRVLRRARPRAPLAPELRQELADYFRADIELLGSMLGRDLGHWLDSSRHATVR